MAAEYEDRIATEITEDTEGECNRISVAFLLRKSFHNSVPLRKNNRPRT
jgi:hypothetical protein